jgi:hypothetical protein
MHSSTVNSFTLVGVIDDHPWCRLLLFRSGVHSGEAAAALLFEADRNAMTTLALIPH